MGYLIRDHRSTTDWTGSRDGRLEEWDTVSCKHCQAIVRIIIRGVNRAREHHRDCPECKGPLCRDCDAAYGATKTCPGDLRARIERALDRGRAEASVR